MKSNVANGGTKMKRPSIVIFLLWETPDVRAQFSEAGVRELGTPIPAPDFTLKAVGGGKIYLKELRGKIVVLNFFSSWCPICRGEHLSFEKLHKEFKDKNIVFLVKLLTALLFLALAALLFLLH